jgi:hypothetical protein
MSSIPLLVAKYQVAFSPQVTAAGWLEDGQLLRNAHQLEGIPGVLIHGRTNNSSSSALPTLFQRIAGVTAMVISGNATP